MRYRSTVGKAPLTSLRGAVLRGLAPDGGLYMPAEIARHSTEELEEFRRLPFTEVCFRVVKPFATPDVPEEELWQIVAEAINFPVKLVSLSRRSMFAKWPPASPMCSSMRLSRAP